LTVSQMVISTSNASTPSELFTIPPGGTRRS